MKYALLTQCQYYKTNDTVKINQAVQWLIKSLSLAVGRMLTQY